MGNSSSTSTKPAPKQTLMGNNPSTSAKPAPQQTLMGSSSSTSAKPAPQQTLMGSSSSTSAKPTPQQTLLFSSQSSSKKEMVEMGRLAVKHEVFDVVKNTFVNIEKIPAASFVGTLDNEYFTSMACLLKDGTVLTTLHSVFDFEQNEYIDLNNLTVSFTHKGYFFTYAVKAIVHDGYAAMRADMSSFDYASLSLVGNPLSDLGGGLELDPQNHYGSASNTDPSQTQAISGPLWHTNEEGQMVVRQLTSLSANAAAQSDYYLFSQEGDHYGNPGFSGQAILYPNTSTLYAIHVGLDNQLEKRIGIKISEYITTYKIALTLDGTAVSTYQPRTVDATLGFQREKLRRRGLDIAVLENFLDQLKQAVNSNNGLNTDNIPASLKLKVVDSHQAQHLQNGHRKGKSYFSPFLANSADSPVINALANCVNKLVSEYYQRYLKTPNAVQNASIRRNTKFIVNLDINVGIDIAAGNMPASCILIDGFGGEHFHIYPVVPEGLKGSKPVIINANDIINAAKNRPKHYVK